jgi:DMSO reductase anchor subunit
MHPAKSVIFFTTLSGAGYGLLFASIVGYLYGFYTASNTQLLVSMALAFVMVSSGLMSSTFHLGHPERAWRAFSQWRTSWLSREGVCAVLTYAPWALFTATLLFIDNPALQHWAGMIAATLALVTVYTTSMIYRSLKAIHAWYNVYVSPLYLMFSITTGLIILNLVLFLSTGPSEKINNLALVTLIVTLLLKRAYWRSIAKKSDTSLETATGLGHMGKVTALEHPHQEKNYLLKEMGFQVARKHSAKLRNIFTIAWIIAVICTGLTLVFSGSFTVLLAIAATAAMAIGVAVERWLFFAEAKHSQALYYGH